MSQLTLKHETYNLGRGLGELYTRGEFVDVVLACQGEQVQAHRAVLAASSLQFRALLKLQPWQHPIVVLQDAELTQVKALVDFMYHGEVTVDQNDVVGFLKLAEALQVIGLMKDKEKVREVIDVNDEEILNGAPGTYKRPHTPTPQPAKIARFGDDSDVSAHNTGSEEMLSSPVASTSQEEQWMPSIYNAVPVDQQSWVPEDELPMQQWTIPGAPKVEVSQEPSLQMVPLLGVEDDIKIEEEELHDITVDQEETTGKDNAEGVENYTQQLVDDTQRPVESYVGETPLTRNNKASGAPSTSLSTTLKQPSTTKSNPSIAPIFCKISVAKGVVNRNSHINKQANCTEAKSKNLSSPSRATQSNSGPSIKINVQNIFKANVPVPPSQGEPLPSKSKQSKSVKTAVTPSCVTTKSRGRPKSKQSSKHSSKEVVMCPPTALQDNDLNNPVSEQAGTSQPSTSQASTSRASSQPGFSSRGRRLKPRVTEPLESNFEDDSDRESYGEYSEDEDNTTQDDRRDVSVQSHVSKTSQPSDDFTFTCDICPKYYKNKIKLNRHYRIKHPTIGRLPCIFCKAKFSNSQDLEQHKFNLHANEFYHQACSVCGKKFTLKSSLKSHLKEVHHRNIELNLSSRTDCDICFQKFNFCTEKSEHLMKVHPELCFKCRLCPKVFSARLFRYGHEMKCHGQNIDNPEHCFPCSLCKMALSSQSRLNKHMKFVHKN